MASTDLHVNGPAEIQVSFGSAYVGLGYSEDGVQVDPREHQEPIYSDHLGPMIPADIQYLGESALIRATLIQYDRSNMETLESRFRSGKTAGTVPQSCIGTLYFAASKYIGVQYGSTARCGLSAEKYKQFPYATVQDVMSFRVGTRVTRITVTFFAIARDGLLYNNIAGTS